MPLDIGAQVSHFRLLEKLGAGATGDVYRAEDILLQRLVALKLLIRAQSPEQQERFLREARLCSAMNHPNIAIVYEAGWHETFPFLAMELVEGEMLSQRIREGRVTYENAIHYVKQILDALDDAHSRGIIHRDIKASNLKISLRGQIKILDFGMAKNILRPGAQLTEPGSIVGTVEFLSPEQAKGEEPDARSDLYSVGAVLYHMLRGKPPFERETQVATLSAILREEAPIEQYFSGTAARVLRKALSKDRLSRYQNAKEFYDDLLKWEQEGFSQRETKTKDISIAILYFETSETTEQTEYLRLGITEDIITDLSKVKDITVLSRHAVQKFKDRNTDPISMMRNLNVRYLLHGTVQSSNDRIRITARLLNESSPMPVWSANYEREIQDIFELQEEVARSITAALQIQLTESEKKSLAHRPTADVKAYESFLKGRQHYNASTVEDNCVAEEMLSTAIKLDPSFAAAHSALAEVYVQRFYNWFDRKREWLQQAEQSVNTAMRFNDQLPDLHCTLGMLLYLKGDYRRAMEEIEKAIRLDPNYALAHDHSGEIYLHQGDLEKAILAFHTELRINPEVIYPYFYLVWIHSLLGDYRLARDVLQQAMKKHGNNPLIFVLRGTFGSYSNDLIQAEDDLNQAIRLNANNSFALARLAVVHARKRNFAEAFRMVEAATEVIDPGDHHAAFDRACVYSLAGRNPDSLIWLHRAIDTGWKCLHHYLNESNLASVRNDPQFSEILSRLKSK